jgi:hypothetical protein
MLDAALEGAQVPRLGSFLQIAEDRKNVPRVVLTSISGAATAASLMIVVETVVRAVRVRMRLGSCQGVREP